MFVKFISKNIQEKLKSKERALAWKTSNANASVANGSLRPKDIMSRTTFVRMCSNKDKVPNIVISGGEIGTDGQMGFGLQQLYKASSVGARPVAGIKNIEVNYKGSWKAIREATVNWTVSSIDDLERLTPYFLTVGKTVVLDWGWVNTDTKSFNQQFGLSPFITKKDGKFIVDQEIFYNPQKTILNVGGDYDAIGGKVSNFEYTLRPDGGFDCVTKITAIGSALFQKPLDTGGNTVDTAIDREGEKSTGFDGIINAIINLRSIIVYQVFGVGIKYDDQSKKYRKKAELYATFKTDAKEINVPGRAGLPIPSFDTDDNHSVWIGRSTEKKGGYSINVDDKNNPNVLWLVFPDYNEEIFVTWAWLEDQLLNRYISFVGGEEKGVKLTLRSIDTALDDTGSPILTKDLTDEDAVKYGIKKEEIDELFKKSEIQFINESNFNEVVKTPTIIRNEPDFLFPVNAFKFLIPERLPDSSRVDNLHPWLRKEQKNFLKELKTNTVFKKNPFTDPNNREYGRLRNIWVNIKEIQKAFGIKSTDASTMDKDAVNPPGTLEKGIKNLLNSLNSNFNNFWDFELTVDPYDSTNVKIIDKNVTDLSEQSTDSKTVKYTTFESGNTESSGERPDREGKESHKTQNLGIYKFPSFKVGSIVKNQNLTFKIPDSMALTILYGSNKPSAKNTSLSSFNNPEIAKLFSTHVTGSDEKDKFSDKYLSSLEPSYYGKAKVQNDFIGSRAVLPTTVGSEKSNHNSIIGLGIENGPLVINPYNYWWKRWTGVGVAPANPVDKTQKRKPITKFEISENNIVAVTEKSEVKETKKRTGRIKGEVQYRTISDYTTVVGEFELSDDNPPIYEWSNFTELLLKSDVQVLVNSKLNGSLSTGKELKVDTIIPAELTLEIDGIGGILPGDVVQTDYIQPQYNANFYKNTVDYGPLTYFQVVGVSQKVESAGWTTELQTKMRWNHIPAVQDLMVDTVPKEIFEVKEPTTTTIPEILPDPPPRPDIPIPSDEEDIEGDLPLEPLEFEDYEVWVPPPPAMKLRRAGPPEFNVEYVYQPNNPPPPRPEIPTKHIFDPAEIPDEPITELEFDDIDWTEWELPPPIKEVQVTFSKKLQEEWTEKKEQPVKKEQLTFTKYFGIMYRIFGPTAIFWWDSSWGTGASTGWKTAWKATDNKWSRRLFNKVSVNQIASDFAGLNPGSRATPHNKELGWYPQPDVYFVIGKNYPGADGQGYQVQDIKSISNYPSPATGTVRLSLMHIEGQYNQLIDVTPVVAGG